MTMLELVKGYIEVGFTKEEAVELAKADMATSLETLENKLNGLLEKLEEAPKKATGGTKKSAEQKWEEKKAEREAFKSTHTCLATADENKAKVYEAMGYVKGSGAYFDKALYKATAKKLGVLGKSGKVVGTYVENK